MTFNFSMQSHERQTHLVLTNVVLVFSYLTFFVGVTGNFMVIWVAGFKLKVTVTNVWLVNLAVADFIFSLTQAFYIFNEAATDWPYGLFFCRFFGVFKYANMFCSVFLLAVISVDRVLCIWKPIFMKHHRTVGAARVVAVCVWAASTVFSSPYFALHKVNHTRNRTLCNLSVRHIGPGAVMALNLNFFLTGFLLPFIVILVSHVLAVVGLRRTRLVGKSRPICLLASLVIAFFVCWGPFHILLLLMTTLKRRTARVWFPLSAAFAYLHSCVNPILYFCTGLKMQGRARPNLMAAFKRALAEDINDQNNDVTACSSDERSGSSETTAAEAPKEHFDPAVVAETKV